MLSANELKHLSALKVKKYREETRLFIAEGVKQVDEGVRSRYQCDLIVFRPDARDEIRDILNIASKKGIKCEEVKAKELERLSDTVNTQGVIGYFRMPHLSAVDCNLPVLVYLDRINDPGNLGTIIRTADWFGFRDILLSPGCVDVFNPKVVRASMGSIFRGVFHPETGIELLTRLKKEGYSVITTELEGTDLKRYRPAGKSIIVLSSESHGVLPELASLADARVKIPGVKGAESLNVAVAAGIILHKLFETGTGK